MDFYSFAPIAAVLDGAYTVVTALASLLAPLAGGASAALAIILITVLVRAALIPVGRSQVRAEFTRRRLAPKLQELRRRHGKNPDVLQRKTMELYAREKASPLAGCLPMLAQLPVISTLYALFILTTVNGHPNHLLTEQLGGVPLGTSLVTLLGTAEPWPGLIVFAVALTLIAATAWLSRRVALRFAEGQPTDGVPPAMQSLMGPLSWVPFLTVVFAAVVPLAATLYLTVTTAWTLAERVILRRVMQP